MSATAWCGRVPWCRFAPLALAAMLAILLAVPGCGNARDSGDEEDHPVSAPPRLTTEQGHVVVTLDPQTLSRSGIVVEALTTIEHARSQAGYGSVLDVSDLAQLRGAFSAARARLDKGRATWTASQAEFKRLQTLYAEGGSTSQKALQAAAAEAGVDEAEVQAATGALEAERALARQRWGTVLAEWLENGSPELDALLQERQRVLEITFRADESPPRPGTAVAVQTAARPVVAARVLSPAPRTDQRIQGVSVLCTAPASPELLPGVTVEAQVPFGPGVPGVVVPASAVVWWQGRAWVYVEKKTGTFSRSEVATDVPVPSGWFVTVGVAAGERVVVRGAQMLLSEEGRSAVHGSEG